MTPDKADIFSAEYAAIQDALDPLSHFRSQFHVPTIADLNRPTLAIPSNEDPSQTCTYLCGNSLGLQPLRTAKYIDSCLMQWRTKGVKCHFLEHNDSLLVPSLNIDDQAAELAAPVVGALEHEVAVMGTLTANLHFLMSSFYRPSKPGEGKWKIMLEGKAFPSDHVCLCDPQLRCMLTTIVRNRISNPASRSRTSGSYGVS